MPSHRKGLSAGEAWLAAGVIIVGVVLTPITFAVLFLTVYRLLHPVFGWWAWSVPLATEIGFVGFYTASLLLALRGRDLHWLRLTPWLLAGLSGFLNVYAAHGSVPGMAGHLAVVFVFFGYLLAAEAVVRRLAEDPEQFRVAQEKDAACRYARDLLRDREGFWWRHKVPSLLRTQVLRGRLPASVTASLAGGAAIWEPEVRSFVIAGLVADAWMLAEETVTRREIEASAKPPAEPSPQPSRPPARRPRGQLTMTDKVTAYLTAHPDAQAKQVMKATGASESTVDRARRKIHAQARSRIHAVGKAATPGT